MAENLDNLLNLSETALFDELEKLLKIKIPNELRNILEFNDVDSASVISRLDGNYIAKIESFMKNVSNPNMIPNGKSSADFLGKFDKNQKHFEFSVGQRIVLEVLYEFFNKKNAQVQTKSSDESKILFEDDINVDHEVIDLPKYIGSLMITV